METSDLQLSDDGFYTFACPHCGVTVQVAAAEINCTIFRCGVFKATGQQLPPHTSKETCDAARNDIYGCGKPFRFTGQRLEVCDYI